LTFILIHLGAISPFIINPVLQRFDPGALFITHGPFILVLNHQAEMLMHKMFKYSSNHSF